MLRRRLKKIQRSLDLLEFRQDLQAQTLERIEASVCRLVDALLAPKAVDLDIVFGSPQVRGMKNMANKKATGPAVKCPCLAHKGGKKAVMPDVTLTDPLPASITLQPLDASGNVVALTPADNVQGTLTSSNSAVFSVTQTADSLHFVGTIPANTSQGSTTDLTATLKGTIGGAAADLNASVHVIINLPPAPVAVDLAIIFG